MKDELRLLDTNIVVYFYSKDELAKQRIALSLLEHKNLMVTRQVINELCNILICKFAKSAKEVGSVLDELENIPVLELTENTTRRALDIIAQYHYSFGDSMLLASAIENDCSTLYSEDFQHGQIIRGKLKIINPFYKIGINIGSADSK